MKKNIIITGTSRGIGYELALQLAKTPTEKMSFFGVFIYFLAIETLVTIRILNNKQ
jgi:hypothetical protein